MKLKKLLATTVLAVSGFSMGVGATNPLPGDDDYYYEEEPATTQIDNTFNPENTTTSEANAAAVAGAAAVSGSVSGADASNEVTFGNTTQTVGDNTQTVGDTTQTVDVTTGDTIQAVGVETGDNTQTNDQRQNQRNAQNNSQAVNTGAQTTSYHNETKVGAITGAPNLGNQYIAGECKTGWAASIGGGTPYSGSGGFGIQKTNKDDECIRESRQHQKDMQAAAHAHETTVTVINAQSNETIARIQAAQAVTVTGMQHLCNLAFNEKAVKTHASKSEHHSCENNTNAAMEFLFPGTTSKAPAHKH